MSTRSRISILDNGKIKSIFCHWDGYLRHNGLILLNHYKTAERINKLLDFGSLDVLGEKLKAIDYKVYNNTYDSIKKKFKYQGYCAIHNKPAKIFRSVKQLEEWGWYDGEEYNYLFKDGK